ncbi:MAG: hypothetical protein ACYDC2_05775 [Solirubrobacteraceae bacterium]
MRSRLRKTLPVLAAAIAAFALSACGESHTRVTTGTYAGESGQNAPYLDVGPLIYQVQLSRQLNPANSEDQAYLSGLSPTQAKLEPGEEWFGVFLQVYNHEQVAHPAATDISIYDTQGNTYTPVIPEVANEYAYRGGPIQPKQQIPAANTPAAFAASQGSLLLFKIKISSLDNRPLELKIVSPESTVQTAQAELDV